MDMSREYIDNPHYLNTLLMDDELIEESENPEVIANNIRAILDSPIY